MLVSTNRVVSNAISALKKPDVVVCVGNGFDLGLGLDTDYKSFLRQYLVEPIAKDGLLEWFKSKIKDGLENWGDAERAFGSIDFNQFGGDAVETMRVCLKDFQRSFLHYLAAQQKRLVIPKSASADVAVRFRQAVVEMLKSAVPQLFESMVDPLVGFINFNYTNTLEAILGGHAKTARTRQGVRFGKVVHVHGDLSSPLFGVDNPSQVACPDIRKLSEIEGLLLKPQMAQYVKSSRYSEAVSMVDAASTICLFGLSYGPTDASWWMRMATKVMVRKALEQRIPYVKQRVILCPYTESPIHIDTAIDAMTVRRREIERFKRNISVAVNSAQQLDDDVFCVLKHGPFKDPYTGANSYCDPLHLASIGAQYVKGYKGRQMKVAR